MQTYDFTEDGDVTGAVYDEIAKMQGFELAKVHEAIKTLREEAHKEREDQVLSWFNDTIVPALKDVAQSVGAVLEISTGKGEIDARIRKPSGFEVGMDANRLRMAMFMADSISIETMDDEVWFTLIYDVEHLAK